MLTRRSSAPASCPLTQECRAARARGPALRQGIEAAGRPGQRAEFFADKLERPVVESRTDLGDVDELAVLVEAQVQGAEVGARALGRRVAADDELLPELTLDLEPVLRASREVQAVALLRDHALEMLLAGGGEEFGAVADDMIAVVDDAARG